MGTLAPCVGPDWADPRFAGNHDCFMLMEHVPGFCPLPTDWKRVTDVQVGIVNTCCRLLARLHARNWGRARVTALVRRCPWLDHRASNASFAPAMAEVVVKPFARQWSHALPASWDLPVLQRYARVLVPVLAYMDATDGAVVELARANGLAAPSVTMLHGDFRATNMIWPGTPRQYNTDTPSRDASNGPVVLDWQLVTIGNPMAEFAHWMTVDLPVEYRRQHEASIFRRCVGACG